MIETDNKLKGKINSNSSIKGSGISVKGETGNGIEKIEKTNTEGLIDTYTIYYTDGTTSIFQVSNGGKGDKGDKPIKGVDYFTPAEVQDIQNNILDNVNQFSVEVVETLPIQNIKDHTIYFVPKTTAEQNDIYDEYIYINNSWEHIGTTEVDLSNYYNKSEVDTKVNSTKEHKYHLNITTAVESMGQVTLPFYYKVGSDCLDVFYMGERLIKNTSDVEGHYNEVGDAGSVSNKIQVGWKVNIGRYFDFVVRGDYSA